MDSKTIGHKLRALRGEMDAKTVADALGISTSALFMYERGERIPRDQIKKRIAQYFGQSVEEIFFAERVHIVLISKEMKKMSNSKRPHAPKEEKRRAQEIQLSHLDNRFSCQIDGTVIQNVKDYSLVQSSNGKALLNLTIEISAEVVSTTIQAQMQQHL